MTSNPSAMVSTTNRAARLLLSMLCFIPLFAGASCSRHPGHTSDPQLRKIDDLIDAQIPTGTPLTRVSFFLSSRGYPAELSRDPHAIVAIVRHVDTDTLQPITARVTFHFDDHDKLISYNLVPAPDVPVTP